jgi:tetratricopeptide (TPR) repeat protein
MERLSRSLGTVAGLLLLATLTSASSARAQGPLAPAGEHAAAQDAHRHALALFDRGQFGEALAEFKRAYGLSPSFRIQYNIGLSQVALGDAAGAVEAFGLYLREGGERIPAPRRAQVEAEMARLSKQLGSLQLDVDDPDSEVMLDGAPLGQGPWSRALQLNQGKHTVAVRSSDGTLRTQTIQLSAGQQQRLRFDRRSARADASSGGPRDPAAPPVLAPPPERRVPWFAWGVTGALGVGATVSGVLALNAHADERDAQARQGVTGDELRAARDKVGKWALASDVLLAGTAVAAGVSLYLTLKPSPRAAETALLVGPGALALRGRF